MVYGGIYYFLLLINFKMSKNKEIKENGKVAQVEKKLEKFETKTDEKVDNLVKKV